MKAQARKTGYVVRARTGSTSVYRGGERVGEHPEVGYDVIVAGRGRALAGTEAAAHAMAEVMKDVSPYRRRFVLTEAEYEEHRDVLRRNLEDLRERFPYSEEEAAAVRAREERYAAVIRDGEANVRAALLNLNPYENFLPPRVPKRPDFPPLDEPSGPRM